MSTLKIKRENGKIFCPLADSWHIETPEEKVRQEYIKILVENYKSYIKRIKTNRHQERMRLMLINKYYWNVALLTLLLSGNETLKPFIENDLGITSISTIELKFNFKYFDDVKVQFTRDYTR